MWFWKRMLWHSFKKNCIQGGLGEWKIPPTESTECGGSSETSVSFFYLWIWIFLIAFLEKVMPELVISEKLNGEGNAMASAFWESNVHGGSDK